MTEIKRPDSGSTSQTDSGESLNEKEHLHNLIKNFSTISLKKEQLSFVSEELAADCTEIFHAVMAEKESEKEVGGRTHAAYTYLVKHRCKLAVGGYGDGKVLQGMDIFIDGDEGSYPGPPLSKARAHFDIAPACVDRFVFCAGGKDETGACLKSVEILTFGHSGRPVGVWHELDAKLNTPRADLSLISYRGGLVAVGGVNSSGQVLSSVESLDTKIGGATWQPFATLNVARRNPILRVLSSEVLVVIGGYDADGELCCSVEMYDTKIGDWVLGPLPVPNGISPKKEGVAVEGAKEDEGAKEAEASG